MREILEDITPLWDRLKNTKKPITLYGMGNGAEKVLNYCEKLDIPVEAIFASDGFARRNVFRSYVVLPYNEVQQRLGEMVVLLCFGSQSPKVLADIELLGKEQELYVPDMPVFGDNIFTKDFFNKNLVNFETTYNLLADELSKKTYANIIKFKISGDPSFLREVAVSRKEMFSELFDFSDEEIFVDAGAYNGDTIAEFLAQTNGSYKEIFALEPDKRNFRKLGENTQGLNNIHKYNVGAWSHEAMLYFRQKAGRSNSLVRDAGEPNTPVNSIDNILGGAAATYINYDVEGAEKEALIGSQNTITKYYPKLLVSAYHRTEDLFALPLQLKGMAPNYKLYIRHNPYMPAWDIGLIAIPKGDV